jgi:hypothetical protein
VKDSGFRKALERTASLLPAMPGNHPAYRGNRAVTVLRVFLWLMPAFLIPVIVVLGAFLNRYLPAAANIGLMFVLWIAATAGIGFFEELLRSQQMRVAQSSTGRRTAASSAVYFLWLQFVIAPVLLVAALLVLVAVGDYFF